MCISVNTPQHDGNLFYLRSMNWSIASDDAPQPKRVQSAAADVVSWERGDTLIARRNRRFSGSRIIFVGPRLRRLLRRRVFVEPLT